MVVVLIEEDVWEMYGLTSSPNNSSNHVANCRSSWDEKVNIETGLGEELRLEYAEEYLPRAGHQTTVFGVRG